MNTVSSSASLPDAPVAQDTAGTATTGQPNATRAAEVTLKGMPRRVVSDLGAVATSPAHIQKHQMVWLLPLAGATATTIATDHEVMANHVTHDPSINGKALNISDGFVGGMVAAPVALFAYGEWKDSARATESGLLSGESVVDAFVVGEVIKLVTRRERPPFDNANGNFWSGHVSTFNSSFPSMHSIAAWSIAGSLATEYPNKWAEIGLYTMASGVSVTRILGQEHFPSDMLVGSAAGWLIGHYVVRSYQRHHPRLAAQP